jgi:hypothetical protein
MVFSGPGAGHPWPCPLPAGWAGWFTDRTPLPYVPVDPILIAEIETDGATDGPFGRPGTGPGSCASAPTCIPATCPACSERGPLPSRFGPAVTATRGPPGAPPGAPGLRRGGPRRAGPGCARPTDPQTQSGWSSPTDRPVGTSMPWVRVRRRSGTAGCRRGVPLVVLVGDAPVRGVARCGPCGGAAAGPSMTVLHVPMAHGRRCRDGRS